MRPVNRLGMDATITERIRGNRGVMSDKLQKLTDQIYRDGVGKARSEAEALLREARERGEGIVRKAEAEAEAIAEKGRREVEALRFKAEAELTSAARQTESALKQRAVTFLVNGVLHEEVGRSLRDEALLSKLILKAMDTWAASGEVPNLSLMLSGALERDFLLDLQAALKSHIDQGLSISFSDKTRSGFKFESKDGTYNFSFTDKDFEEFFRSFMKEKTRTILFGSE